MTPRDWLIYVAMLVATAVASRHAGALGGFVATAGSMFAAYYNGYKTGKASHDRDS